MSTTCTWQHYVTLTVAAHFCFCIFKGTFSVTVKLIGLCTAHQNDCKKIDSYEKQSTISWKHNAPCRVRGHRVQVTRSLMLMPCQSTWPKEYAYWIGAIYLHKLGTSLTFVESCRWTSRQAEGQSYHSTSLINWMCNTERKHFIGNTKLKGNNKYIKPTIITCRESPPCSYHWR